MSQVDIVHIFTRASFPRAHFESSFVAVDHGGVVCLSRSSPSCFMEQQAIKSSWLELKPGVD
eukprot:scaffold2243_cov165-Amphora_coffeaeformis.AAC.14